MRQSLATLQEPVEVLIENDPVEGSYVTPLLGIGTEQNHPADDGGMEETDELHQNDDTQGIRRMMQGSSNNLITSLRGIDALKVKSTVSEFNDKMIIWNIRVENSDELQSLLRAGVRLVCEIVGVIAAKKEFKEPHWKRLIQDDIARL